MFSILSLLAFGVFAPTVLLPLLHEHTVLLSEEHRLEKSVADLEREFQRRLELLDAFENDALMNERLALLDLNYRRPNEEVMPVFPASEAAMSKQPNKAESTSRLDLPDHWPAWSHRAEARASGHGLISLFISRALRPLLLMMAGGLIVAAFVLFAPRPTQAGRDTAGRAVLA